MLNNIYNIDREFDYVTIKGIVVNSDNLDVPVPSTPSLKLKIRNTTKYLNWRLSILKRDNFTCKICHASVKENKSLRLEVHHAKSFDEICEENNVCTVEEALDCKELWNTKNGVSICYRCHKDVEKLRTKLRNMFQLENAYT
jgi:5-methylcytosine-specific restriction endonuclease McrA